MTNRPKPCFAERLWCSGLSSKAPSHRSTRRSDRLWPPQPGLFPRRIDPLSSLRLPSTKRTWPTRLAASQSGAISHRRAPPLAHRSRRSGGPPEVETDRRSETARGTFLPLACSGADQHHRRRSTPARRMSASARSSSCTSPSRRASRSGRVSVTVTSQRCPERIAGNSKPLPRRFQLRGVFRRLCPSAFTGSPPLALHRFPSGSEAACWWPCVPSRRMRARRLSRRRDGTQRRDRSAPVIAPTATQFASAPPPGRSGGIPCVARAGEIYCDSWSSDAYRDAWGDHDNW